MAHSYDNADLDREVTGLPAYCLLLSLLWQLVKRYKGKHLKAGIGTRSFESADPGSSPCMKVSARHPLVNHPHPPFVTWEVRRARETLGNFIIAVCVSS